MVVLAGGASALKSEAKGKVIGGCVRIQIYSKRNIMSKIEKRILNYTVVI